MTDPIRVPSVAALRHAMRAHWLASIECDHDNHRDRPTCGCSRYDLGWHSSIGDAIEAFNKHVEAMAGVEPGPACIHDQLRQKEKADKKYWRDRALRAEARAEDLDEEVADLSAQLGVPLS